MCRYDEMCNELTSGWVISNTNYYCLNSNLFKIELVYYSKHINLEFFFFIQTTKLEKGSCFWGAYGIQS